MPPTGFDAFTPQAGNAPVPSAYQATNGYQAQTDSYQPAQNPPTVSSGKGLSAPAGAQDQYDAFLGGRPSKPLMNSATGHLLDGTGQVDESGVNKNTLWQRLGINGRLGAGLDTGSMLASMIPSGRTIGENIAGVAGAIHNLPYAELLHQYQMAGPSLERAKELSGIQLQQAQAQEALQRGEYFSGRNQAGILAQQLRGQSAEALRAQSGKAQPYWSQAPEAGVSPHGEPWAKGQQVWGYRIPSYVPGNPQDPTDPGHLEYTFEPHSTEDEEMKARWGLGMGHSVQGSYIQSYMHNNPRGAQGNIDPATPQGQQALMDEATQHYEQQTKINPGLALLTGQTQVRGDVPDKAGQAQIAKADDEAYKTFSKVRPNEKPEDLIYRGANAWLAATNSTDPKVRAAAGDNPHDYAIRMQQEEMQHDAQLAMARSNYLNQPPAKRKGFTGYLLQNGYDFTNHTFTKPIQQTTRMRVKIGDQTGTIDSNEFDPATMQKLE